MHGCGWRRVRTRKIISSGCLQSKYYRLPVKWEENLQIGPRLKVFPGADLKFSSTTTRQKQAMKNLCHEWHCRKNLKFILTWPEICSKLALVIWCGGGTGTTEVKNQFLSEQRRVWWKGVNQTSRQKKRTPELSLIIIFCCLSWTNTNGHKKQSSTM